MSCFTETRDRILPGLFVGIMGNVGNRTSVVLVLYLWLVVTTASVTTESEGAGLERPTRPGTLQTNAPTTPDAAHYTTGPTKSATWPTLGLVLLSVLAFAVFVVLIKRRIFRCHQSSYREALLPDGDATSQISRDGMLTPYVDQDGRMNSQGNGRHDDDGFIEDNYITSNEKDEAEKEEVLQEDSDDELYIDF